MGHAVSDLEACPLLDECILCCHVHGCSNRFFQHEHLSFLLMIIDKAIIENIFMGII